jgi:hypothetical protein
MFQVNHNMRQLQSSEVCHVSKFPWKPFSTTIKTNFSWKLTFGQLLCALPHTLYILAIWHKNSAMGTWVYQSYGSWFNKSTIEIANSRGWPWKPCRKPSFRLPLTWSLSMMLDFQLFSNIFCLAFQQIQIVQGLKTTHSSVNCATRLQGFLSCLAYNICTRPLIRLVQ